MTEEELVAAKGGLPASDSHAMTEGELIWAKSGSGAEEAFLAFDTSAPYSARLLDWARSLDARLAADLRLGGHYNGTEAVIEEAVLLLAAEAAQGERDRLTAKAREWHDRQHRGNTPDLPYENCRWQPCPSYKRLLAEPVDDMAWIDRCGCRVDAELNESSVCPACGHRDHGRSGCEAPR